ncbi:MarR family winged helix-turn-helix transcriptional regulator [Paraburkholderia sp. MM5482-R1]|uniref:MarR family winged helix-turn-helix transcriptional regulator n=1 Tax=unclassified Paraburkholderia TaxID=2615204 RepID=UPI003D20B26A
MAIKTMAKPLPIQGQTVEQVLDALIEINARPGLPERADAVFGSSDVLIEQWRAEFSNVYLDGYEVSVRLRRIAMLLDENLATVSHQFGLKPNEVLLLMALRRVGAPYCLRPTDILKMHSVTSGTVTYRIDQLVKQDLAERIADPTDLRGYLIRLTSHGLEIINSVIEISARNAQLILADIFSIPNAGRLLIELLRAYEYQIENTDLPRFKVRSKRREA